MLPCSSRRLASARPRCAPSCPRTPSSTSCCRWISATLVVTSVSKRPQRLEDAAAAVYVITQEDLHRTGVTSIPDALRMAPGVEVAQVNAHSWAISIRGFNGTLANKILVLVDGRSVYTPVHGGTYWDDQFLPIEEIDHIEVIRGPAARPGGRTPPTASSTSSPSTPRRRRGTSFPRTSARAGRTIRCCSTAARFPTAPITAPTAATSSAATARAPPAATISTASRASAPASASIRTAATATASSSPAAL
ncbi:MAG: Plug domain-containing protein [Alphaproteobacteria bacterium]